MTVDPEITGQCDTPGCPLEATTISPDGYVCRDCSTNLEQKYRSAERRDHAEPRVGR